MSGIGTRHLFDLFATADADWILERSGGVFEVL